MFAPDHYSIPLVGELTHGNIFIPEFPLKLFFEAFHQPFPEFVVNGSMPEACLGLLVTVAVTPIVLPIQKRIC